MRHPLVSGPPDGKFSRQKSEILALQEIKSHGNNFRGFLKTI
jgi:hypothetical protein